MMKHVVFQRGSKRREVYSVMTVESLVLGINKSIPENGVNLLKANGSAVFAKEFAYLDIVGTIDHGGLRRTLVLDGAQGRRLAKQPEQVIVNCTQVEEE